MMLVHDPSCRAIGAAGRARAPDGSRSGPLEPGFGTGSIDPRRRSTPLQPVRPCGWGKRGRRKATRIPGEGARPGQPAPVALAGIGRLAAIGAPVELVAAEVPTRRIVPPRRTSGTVFALPLLAPRANAASPGRGLRARPLRAVGIVPTAATLSSTTTMPALTRA